MCIYYIYIRCNSILMYKTAVLYAYLIINFKKNIIYVLTQNVQICLAHSFHENIFIVLFKV